MPCIQIFIIQHQNIPLRKNSQIKNLIYFLNFIDVSSNVAVLILMSIREKSEHYS